MAAENNLKKIKYDAWCSTKFMETPKFTFIWTIENYHQTTETIFSDVFTIKGQSDSTKWRLRFEPKKESDEDSGNIGLYLESKNNRELTVTFRLAVLNREKKRQKCFAAEKKKMTPGSNWGWPKFLTTDEVKNLEVNDTLTLGSLILID